MRYHYIKDRIELCQFLPFLACGKRKPWRLLHQIPSNGSSSADGCTLPSHSFHVSHMQGCVGLQACYASWTTIIPHFH